MAKKATAMRQAHAARRPQTGGKAAAVKLVRPEGMGSGVSAGTPVMARPTQSTPARPAPVARATPPTRTAPKPTPKPTASASQARAARPSGSAPAAPPPSAAARAQLQRAEAAKIARAREMQRARAANLITPEHYGYVKRDLRLTGILAFSMFAIIIILHFVLG